jgi:cell filamentation protein
LFQDVHEWAGQVRTISISKGGTTFARWAFIQGEGKRLGKELAQENFLRGLDKPKFVERLAHHYAEWNALHPYREGNGRCTREFICQLAREAGYELDQSRIDNSREQWNQAAKRSFNGDLEGVKQIFTTAVRPSHAMAFEKLFEAEALLRHPELKGVIDGLHAMRASLAQRFPDNEKAQNHYFAHARSEFQRLLDSGKMLTPRHERLELQNQYQADPASLEPERRLRFER